MTYIMADMDTFDLWVEYGLLELLAFLGKYTEFKRLHGD